MFLWNTRNTDIPRCGELRADLTTNAIDADCWAVQRVRCTRIGGAESDRHRQGMSAARGPLRLVHGDREPGRGGDELVRELVGETPGWQGVLPN